MNILLLADWTYPCDHQFLANVYARNLVDRGHRVTWVMRPDDPARDEIGRETWNGSDVYVLPSEAFDPIRNYVRYRSGRIENNPLFSTGIDFSDVDVVHVRNDLSMGLAAAALAETHDLSFAHQISHLKAETLIEESRRGLRGSAGWMKGRLGKSLRRTVAESADVVLPISESMQEYLDRSGYEAPMEVLPTGAPSTSGDPDGEAFTAKRGIESDRVLIYLGSMSPIRRLEFLFVVLELVDGAHDIELLMVGGRSADHVTRLRDAADERGVSSSVTFTGWIDDRREIQRAVAAADVGVSPLPTDSVLRTNAPIKTLEYMSSGTPVVASSTPDQRSVLAESGAGIAVDHDPLEFSKAIDRILSSPALSHQMSRRGKAWIGTHRNFEVLTRRVERIYERLES